MNFEKFLFQLFSMSIVPVVNNYDFNIEIYTHCKISMYYCCLLLKIEYKHPLQSTHTNLKCNQYIGESRAISLAGFGMFHCCSYNRAGFLEKKSTKTLHTGIHVSNIT